MKKYKVCNRIGDEICIEADFIEQSGGILSLLKGDSSSYKTVSQFREWLFWIDMSYLEVKNED